MALAQPGDLESLGRWKPGQSCGFQAKLGRNITKYVSPAIVFVLEHMNLVSAIFILADLWLQNN